MKPAYHFVGHAIISADDKIADAAGDMPDELRHPADQDRFQAALDQAALIVLGRRSHEAAPNPRRRLRLVMTRSVDALEERADAWWWNPAGTSLEEALATVAPNGGTIAIPGGRGAFDFFLGVRFDAFHLTHHAGVRLPGGVPIFSQCSEGKTADTVLADAGLTAGYPESLGSGVSLTVWQRPKR